MFRAKNVIYGGLFMLNCRQTTQLLSEKQDRKLSIGENVNLYMHITMCSICRRFGKQVKTLSKVSKEYKDYNQDQ